MSLDLDKIKDELKRLPEFKPPFFDQISLQGVEDNPDPFFGIGSMKDLTSYKETDFTEFNFDLPYINHIIEDLNMCRTRVMRMSKKSCYSYHYDKTKRIHIPLVTNKNCFMVIEDEVFRYPADGNYYIVDTTKMHTFVNASFEERIHIVGCI